MERNLMNKLAKEVNQELTHIQKPYSLEEIHKIYLSGNYNAELLLQHTLKKVEEQGERIKDLMNELTEEVNRGRTKTERQSKEPSRL